MATPAPHSYDPTYGEDTADGVPADRDHMTGAQSDQPRFDLSVERRDGALVLHAGGELDLSNCETLDTALQDAAGVRRVVVDVSALEFLDSTGLNLLLREHRRLKAAGVGLVISGAHGEVRRLLRLTGVDRLFALAPDVDAALDG